MIENTSSPASREAFALLAMAVGSTDGLIENQERAGQTQLVHSDCLPTELRSPREEFEALGFAFGQPDPHDPLFTAATLPDGWTKQGSDHDMWSYVLDEHGRRRIGIFYKAAFYDRRADMHIIGLHGYVTSCVYDGKPIVTDDTWATREAVAAVLLKAAEQAQEDVDHWQGIAETRSDWDETSKKYIAKHTAERDKYQALAAEYAA